MLQFLHRSVQILNRAYFTFAACLVAPTWPDRLTFVLQEMLDKAAHEGVHTNFDILGKILMKRASFLWR